ncbi:TMV resistance protein N [Trifolium repens]|nr:TMV resistance protein N [Trifolium repens]
MQSPSSSSSSSSPKFSYDVFLSFRGEDTRYGFTGNLYKALSDKGIRTFIDDKELQRGEKITPSLLKSIENSRIAIIIFSKNYASSSFCLDELAHIIHYFQEKSRLVLPVFYDVEPCNVRMRNQTESYAKDLAFHKAKFQNDKENMERFMKWKIALEQAAELSGYDYNFGNKEYEHELITKIVTKISDTINRVLLHVTDHPVGLESKLLEVKSLLDVDCNNGVYMIGICGSGGMGKTTLTKAIYNLIADQFEGLCFLHDVRENSIKYGLKYLQEQLLFKSIGLEVQLGHYSEGIQIIKERLHQKKVLLILDDIDKLKQLQVLVGEPTWLSPGSRVIITTRDKHLLLSHGIKRIYDLGGLRYEEALELFSWMAFKSNKIDTSYHDILHRAVKYASGLPLALEVVGSNLFGKTIAEWESTLDMYERIPNSEIQEKLKVSFDGLEEEQQSVFLDIACYFKWHRLQKVVEILQGYYGHCIKSHIRVLVHKSLIKICYPFNIKGGLSINMLLEKFEKVIMGTVTLHNLIEDMGKEIVRQESPKESGERSRLWCHDDIIHVLQENTGTSKIEMIYLNFPSMETVIEWDGDAFKKMKNLKTLIIKNGHFSKGPKYLPNTLRVLKWKGCPSFFPPSATVLNKEFKNMKILNLNNCDYLTEISGISYLPNLEKFSFENCKNLITIHDSSWFLSRLQILNAMGCEKLLSFPPLKFISLLELKLSGCKSLKKFPEILNKMKNIKEIILENTGIQELPFSFQNLSELSFLSINGRGKLRLPSSILKMSNLVEVRVYGYSQLLPKPDNKQSSMLSSKVKRLTLIHHPISDDEFLTIALMWFTNVESLILTGSNLKILPSNLEKCCFLETINLDDCKFLEEIRGVPPNLKTLSAIGCKSLTSSSKRMLMNQEVHEAGGTEFYFPSSRSDRIPEWFEHQRREPSISFGFRNKLPSLVFYFSSKRMRELGCNKKDPADIIVYLVINGEVYSLFHSHSHHLSRFRRDYTYLLNFNIQYWTRYINKFRTNIEIDVLDPSGPNYYESEEDVELFKSRLDEALLRNEWIHAEVSFGFGSKYACWDDNDVVESGFHEAGFVFRSRHTTQARWSTAPARGGCLHKAARLGRTARARGYIYLVPIFAAVRKKKIGVSNWFFTNIKARVKRVSLGSSLGLG